MLDDTMMIFFWVLWSLSMIATVYCIWFAIRYDKDKSHILLLLIFTVLYIPFYFSRIKRLKTEMHIQEESEEILDKEFLTTTREGILEILDVWASKEKQIEYHNSENELNITKLLFEEWGNYYKIDNEIRNEAFDESEIILLEAFDEAITKSYEKLNNEIPSITEFQDTKDWKVLNSLASKLKKEII